jgi:DNA-binding XRE family transcriptional regulator
VVFDVRALLIDGSDVSYSLRNRSLLAARCREVRREHLALTQREWAAMLGVSPGTVARWEVGGGGPSLRMIRSMAGASGLPVAWFFDLDQEQADEREER